MPEDIADRLRRETKKAQRENDLPDYLANRIFVIADNLDDRQRSCVEIETLFEQLPLYDTYAQTGYLGLGITHLILEESIARVEQFLSINP
jgi:hypothetical protein